MGFLDIVWTYKFHLAFYILGISTLTYIGLYLVGGVPQELRAVDTSINTPQVVQTTPSKTQTNIATGTTKINQNQGELPLRIIIEKIGVNTPVLNPTQTSNDVLNTNLLKGAVRYPGSGTLANGNMFIFGHSTGIRLVNNQAFKAFNNLKNLNPNDEIKVQSGSREYTYKVTHVSLADSEDVWVDLSSTKNMLTISTCNTFGEKQERFVVQALYVSSKAI